MRARPTLALAAALAVAACDGSPSAPGREGARLRTAPVDPVTAQAASVACPNRCAYEVDPVPGATGRGVMMVTEDARLLGHYFDPAANRRGVFTWSLERGTRSTLLQDPAGVIGIVGRNNWGQTVGHIGYRAGVWEPDGTAAYIRTPDRTLIVGEARAINEHSMIVGTGNPENLPRADRAFFWTNAGGLRYITPENLRGYPTDINAAGTVVGVWQLSSGGSYPSWFIWTLEGGFRNMGGGWAVAISENGHIAGSGNLNDAWMRTPDGQVTPTPGGWEPVDVNDWGEVLLTSQNVNIAPPGTCAAAVWHPGYGLLRLASPRADLPQCHPTSINSWGDVAGTVSGQVNGATVHVPVVWAWKENAYRYVGR